MKDFIIAALPWIVIGLVLIGYFVKRDRLKRNEKVSDYRTEGMCIGMCFGCAMGATNIMNIGSAMSLGLLIGLALGMLIKKEVSEEKDC